ncbi:MAG: thiopurine S-methyltransferase, partial [Phormidesmis sp.]
IDAIYDRAALVALPEVMRDRYTPHLKEITANAPQLLICFEYDQNLMTGPPFSISPQEVARHYEDSYTLTPLESGAVPGGLKGNDAAMQTVWLLQRR